jgi:type I restriction enzyme S subunit
MWTMNSPQFRNHVEEFKRGSTRKRISRGNLALISFPVPPLPEQQRIVAEIETQFTRLDASLAALERVRANLKRYRAATLAAACEGRLFDDHQDTRSAPHSLPAGWKVQAVGQFAEIQGGIQKQPKRTPRDNAYPYLRVANVLRGRLDLAEMREMQLFGNELERLRLRAGDLLVVEGNGSPSEIGRMAVWNGALENCVHQNHIIRVRCGADSLPHYVETFWNSPSGSEQVRRVASSTSGLHTLSVAKVSNLSVPLPPLAEQHRIVTEVERRLSLVEKLEAVVDDAQKRAVALRQSILKRAFEGKLVPQDPDDEPADVLLERIRAERVAISANDRAPKRAGRKKVRA